MKIKYLITAIVAGSLVMGLGVVGNIANAAKKSYSVSNVSKSNSNKKTASSLKKQPKKVKGGLREGGLI